MALKKRKETTYSITVSMLLNRPEIRNDKPYEWMNKMTDEELIQWEKEAKEFLDNEDAIRTEEIDREILYRLIKLNKKKYVQIKQD